MTVTDLIVFLFIGGLAGWLAGLLVKGRGQGILLNIVVGVIGAFIGGWLFRIMGIAVIGALDAFIAAILGAVVLLALLRLLGAKR